MSRINLGLFCDAGVNNLFLEGTLKEIYQVKTNNVVKLHFIAFRTLLVETIISPTPINDLIYKLHVIAKKQYYDK